MVFFLPAPPLAVGWHDVSVSTFHPLQLVPSWNCSLLLFQLRAIDLKCSKRLVGKPGKCEVTGCFFYFNWLKLKLKLKNGKPRLGVSTLT